MINYHIFCDSTYHIIMNYFIINGTNCVPTVYLSDQPVIEFISNSYIDGGECIKYVFEDKLMEKIFNSSNIGDLKSRLLNNFGSLIFNGGNLTFQHRPTISYKILNIEKDNGILNVNTSYDIQIKYDDPDDVGFLNFVDYFHIYDQNNTLDLNIAVNKNELLNNNQFIFTINSEIIGDQLIKIITKEKKLMNTTIIPITFIQD